MGINDLKGPTEDNLREDFSGLDKFFRKESPGALPLLWIL